MPQLRKDPVTNRWIIVNVENPKGAAELRVPPMERSSKVCPFCPGNESMTPPEIAAYGRRGNRPGPDWLVRVIPNKFPALRIEETPDKTAIGIYDKMGGFGAHEVIIETPAHDHDLSELPVEHVELVLRAYRDRCIDLKKDPRFKYVLIFKNYGASAGASLEHPHSQLIALPIVPSRVTGEVKGAARHSEYSDRCVYCDVLDQDAKPRKFTVEERGGFVSFAPFASRFPFETWIFPRAHRSSFDAIPDESLRPLAEILKSTLQRLRGALGEAPYNFMIHTLPPQGRDDGTYHWHIEIIPQLTQVAGFELGTGFYVNPTPPELAAKLLRDQEPKG